MHLAETESTNHCVPELIFKVLTWLASPTRGIADFVDYERTVLVEADPKTAKEAEEKTLISEWRSLLRNSLTGPTLLEMSGNPTTHPSDHHFRKRK